MGWPNNGTAALSDAERNGRPAPNSLRLDMLSSNCPLVTAQSANGRVSYGHRQGKVSMRSDTANDADGIAG